MDEECEYGAPMSATAPPPLDWKFGQVFGERAAGEEVQDVDIICAIEFDKSGDHLATGDKGGRVVMFERIDGKDTRSRAEQERSDTTHRHIDFNYTTEFQSHEPEFDYLKSLDIEEKINRIQWCQITGGSKFLLSTNDKTIKLWKVYDKKVKRVSNFNCSPQSESSTGNSTPVLLGGVSVGAASVMGLRNAFFRSVSSNRIAPLGQSASSSIREDMAFPQEGFPDIHLPTVTSADSSIVARCRRVYSNAHAYHINSISCNSDGETYISADDLRVNLWNMEVSNQCFNIIDLKPSNMEDLTEVITSAEFHPWHCSTLAYSSSKGSIRLVDMRQSALCDTHTKIFEEQENPGTRSFFSEIIASIADIKFAKGGRYILCRDYMTMKLWDLNMESRPVVSYNIHEHLRAKLCDLYENDSIFDKFQCCISGDGLRVATGTYSNSFKVFGTWGSGEECTVLEASKTPNRRRLLQSPSRGNNRLTNLTRGRRDNRRAGSESPSAETTSTAQDLSSKLLHLAWHPTTNLIACAASNSLYMYHA